MTLKVRTKLILLIVIPLVASLSIALLSMSSLKMVSGTATALTQERIVPVLQLERIARQYNQKGQAGGLIIRLKPRVEEPLTQRHPNCDGGCKNNAPQNADPGEHPISDHSDRAKHGRKQQKNHQRRANDTRDTGAAGVCYRLGARFSLYSLLIFISQKFIKIYH